MCKKRCFLIGHREAPESILTPLQKAIETQILEYGVTEFIVGKYGNFDRLAARALLHAKKKHPGLTLSLLLPYLSEKGQAGCPKGFDGTVYPEGLETVPRRFAIAAANRFMMDHVQALIAYVCHPASNAQKLVEEARRRARRGEIQIFLWDPAANAFSEETPMNQRI